jgi:hypothetical protein
MRTAAVAALLLALAALGWFLRDGSRPAPIEPHSVGPSSGSVSKYPIIITAGDETVAGHVRFRLIGARLDPHRDESGVSSKTLELRASLRATEFMNIDTQISSNSIRLLVGGTQLGVEKPFSQRLYASQTADLSDLLFLVPIGSTIATLELGPIDGASALLPLELSR